MDSINSKSSILINQPNEKDIEEDIYKFLVDNNYIM
jgi:hypothetical protein